MKNRKEKEDEPIWSKYAVMSPCCEGYVLCRTMYNVVYCAKCGNIYEKAGKEYRLTFHNMFYYTNEAWEQLVAQKLSLLPEELYLFLKGTLEQEKANCSKRMHSNVEVVVTKDNTEHERKKRQKE